MNISATFNGQAVRIVNTSVNGSDVYVTYIDSSNYLRVARDFFDMSTASSSATSASNIIAFSATGS